MPPPSVNIHGIESSLIWHIVSGSTNLIPGLAPLPPPPSFLFPPLGEHEGQLSVQSDGKRALLCIRGSLFGLFISANTGAHGFQSHPGSALQLQLEPLP